jgi:protein-S-isoprenylcysteine O-methyltransferase Ste14
MLFCWGVFLKAPSWKAAGLSLGVTAFLMATALFEEEENLARFGEAYTEYSNHTWRMIPFLY